MDYYKNLFKTQFTGLAFVIGIIAMIISIFTYREILTYIAFINLFAVFDVVGYGNMIAMPSAEGVERWYDETILVPYRIMQNMFMVLAFIAVYFYTGWICLFACFVGWWMGGCDLLYYILLRIKMREEDYYWMKGWSVWLPITLLRRLLLANEYISRIEFISICSIGLILGGVINFVKV
jgi:hypothetical protein